MQMVMNIRSILNSFRSNQNSHIIEALLQSEDTTLEVLLVNDVELIQELRSRNTSLLRFLSSSMLSQLINYLICEPEVDEFARAHKYPFICNEIISCAIPEILDTFFHETFLLDQLFSFLENRPANLTLAGYFCSTVLCLLKHNSYELLSYIHDNKDLGKTLSEHLYSTSIMNLIYRLLSCEDHGNPAYISKLYDMVDFIFDNFSIVSDVSIADTMQVVNSGELLVSLLSNHNEVFNWSEIQAQLTYSPNVDKLMNYTLSSDSNVASACAAVVCALAKNLDIKHSEENVVSPDVPLLIELFCSKIADYKALLSKPSPVLGRIRLNILKFISIFMRLHYSIIKTSVYDHNLLFAIVVISKQELLPAYPWNSMLHSIIEEILTYILMQAEDAKIKSQVTFK